MKYPKPRERDFYADREGTQIRMQKKKPSSCHTVVKNYDQERLYKPQTASDFSTEILKARRTWDIEYQTLEDG